MDESIRFWKHVSIGEPNDCWPWTLSRQQKGYGVAWDFSAKKNTKAHRLAWRFTNGPIPKGMLVCHRCDNPPCCNPYHLFLGTVADNARDMAAKGRAPAQNGATPRGDKHWTHRKPDLVARGTKARHAKLTDADVVAIRFLHSNGERVTAIARRFGVNHGIISEIVSGKKWRHVS